MVDHSSRVTAAMETPRSGRAEESSLWHRGPFCRLLNELKDKIGVVERINSCDLTCCFSRSDRDRVQKSRVT